MPRLLHISCVVENVTAKIILLMLMVKFYATGRTDN